MEESVNEVETNQFLQSPPRPRRSTFFESRETLAPQTLAENNDTNLCSQSTEGHGKNDEELQRYHDKLLAEKELWKKEVNNRRNNYHDLRLQYQTALKAPAESRLPYELLTDEDIEFLNGKVNISHLVDSQSKLHKSMEETRALYRQVGELEDVILKKCEKRVDEITDYIFENSTIRPKE